MVDTVIADLQRMKTNMQLVTSLNSTDLSIILSVLFQRVPTSTRWTLCSVLGTAFSTFPAFEEKREPSQQTCVTKNK
jgi:hypothetical protein